MLSNYEKHFKIGHLRFFVILGPAEAPRFAR